MQVLVVGAGVVGLAVARAAALAGHEVIVAEAASGIGTGYPRATARSSMPGSTIRPARCAPITARAGGGCSTPTARRTACRIASAASSSSPPTKRARGWRRCTSRRRSTGSRASRSSTARRPASRARARLRRRDALAGDRHHRQPPLMLALRGDLEDHGGMIAFNSPIERLAAGGGWEVQFGGSDPQWLIRSMRWSIAPGSAPSARARDRRLSCRAGAAARPRQGQLFRLRGPAGVLAADLSGAGAGRARRARDARPRRPHALRAGRGMDRAGELRRRSRTRGGVLRAHPRLLAATAGRLAPAGLRRSGRS